LEDRVTIGGGEREKAADDDEEDDEDDDDDEDDAVGAAKDKEDEDDMRPRLARTLGSARAVPDLLEMLVLLVVSVVSAAFSALRLGGSLRWTGISRNKRLTLPRLREKWLSCVTGRLFLGLLFAALALIAALVNALGLFAPATATTVGGALTLTGMGEAITEAWCSACV
jgi:hypothetical protein